MKTVSLTYYINEYDVYSGKIIGFINRGQFHRLFNCPEKYTRKVSSCEPKSLYEIGKVEEYKKHRLVFSTSIKGQRHLLVTGEIDTKDVYFNKKDVAVSMIDSDNNLIHLEHE